MNHFYTSFFTFITSLIIFIPICYIQIDRAEKRGFEDGRKYECRVIVEASSTPFIYKSYWTGNMFYVREFDAERYNAYLEADKTINKVRFRTSP